MKTIMMLLGVLVVTRAAMAAPTVPGGSSGMLVISGVVPDNGFSVKGQTISPKADTVLKIFVANYIQNSRGPASENSKVPQWTQLKGPKNLTASSYVKVVAP